MPRVPYFSVPTADGSSRIESLWGWKVVSVVVVVVAAAAAAAVVVVVAAAALVVVVVVVVVLCLNITKKVQNGSHFTDTQVMVSNTWTAEAGIYTGRAK
jgi:hypothetical protein